MYLSGINPFKLLLKDKSLFWSFYVTSLIRVAHLKFFKRKLRIRNYAGKQVIDHNEANELLKNKLIEDKPFFFGRHGSSELTIATEVLLQKYGLKKINDKIVKSAADCGFFYENEDQIIRFFDEIIYCSQFVNIYGTFRMVAEDFYIKKYMPKNVILTHLNMLDFWRFEKPFTMALKGKKVLVVHPMTETIISQYAKRELLFENSKVLPEFELYTVRAVQSIMGNRDPRFKTWFDALEYMYQECLKVDFEIAILGCGPYGMPLAARLKESGKKVIYMGGVTQILFGIKGKRWDDDPIASKLYNEHWVRPSDLDKPKNFDKREDGCYW